MNNSKLNLGSAFEDFKSLHLFPKNPFLLISIKDRLRAITGLDLVSNAIRDGVGKDEITDVFKLVLGGYRDNPEMMKRLVGIELLEDMEAYVGELRNERENRRGEDDIPAGLYSRPGLFGYLGDN